jgi:hypothetical protein
MSPVPRVFGVLTAALIAGSALLAPGPQASAAPVPGCVAAHLRVVRSGTEGATSHRYVKFRITNTGDRTCRLYGYPTFRYRDASARPMGWASEPAPVPAHVVRLAPGEHTRVTLGYVVPGVALPRQCHARRTASVAFRLAFRPHVYHRPLRADVCTTRKYRPLGYPAGF